MSKACQRLGPAEEPLSASALRGRREVTPVARVLLLGPRRRVAPDSRVAAQSCGMAPRRSRGRSTVSARVSGRVSSTRRRSSSPTGRENDLAKRRAGHATIRNENGRGASSGERAALGQVAPSNVSRRDRSATCSAAARNRRTAAAPLALAAMVVGRRCAQVDGFSLHANVRIAANDREGLEHVAPSRPPKRSGSTGSRGSGPGAPRGGSSP